MLTQKSNTLKILQHYMLLLLLHIMRIFLSSKSHSFNNVLDSLVLFPYQYVGDFSGRRSTILYIHMLLLISSMLRVECVCDDNDTTITASVRTRFVRCCDVFCYTRILSYCVMLHMM